MISSSIGLHPLFGERTGVGDLLLSDAPPARVDRRVVGVGRPAMHHAARTEHLFELRILRIIRQFGFFLGVEVVQVAEELIEPVNGRQKLVAVAEVVLSELARSIAKRLEQFGDRRVLRLQADGCPGHSDFCQAGADRVLAGDEAGAPGRAALLRVIVGEEAAFVGDAVDVRGAVPHHPVAELADVPDADIVTPEDQDIGLFVRHFYRLSYMCCLGGLAYQARWRCAIRKTHGVGLDGI